MIDLSIWRERHDEPELLDQGIGTLQDVQRNLDEMWRINRYLGGLFALTRHLYPRLIQYRGRSVTLADIGCGAANLGVHLARWAQRHGIILRIYSVDIASRNLAIARKTTDHAKNVHLLQADAANLPFAAHHVDYVISSLLLHHLAPSALVTLLNQCSEMASKGIIMSDLVRGAMPMLGFRVVQPVFARHYLTRHDGMLSIRRAYKPDELNRLAEEAGLPGTKVYEHFPWRMTLVVDK